MTHKYPLLSAKNVPAYTAVELRKKIKDGRKRLSTATG